MADEEANVVNVILPIVVQFTELRRRVKERKTFLSTVYHHRVEALIKSRRQRCPVPGEIQKDWDEELSTRLNFGESHQDFLMSMLPFLCEPVRLHGLEKTGRDIMAEIDKDGEAHFMEGKTGEDVLKDAVAEAKFDWAARPWSIIQEKGFSASVPLAHGLSCPGLWAHEDLTPRPNAHICPYTARVKPEGPISVRGDIESVADIQLLRPRLDEVSPTTVFAQVGLDAANVTVEEIAEVRAALEGLQIAHVHIMNNVAVDDKSLAIRLMDVSRYPKVNQLALVNPPSKSLVTPISAPSPTKETLTIIDIHSPEHKHEKLAQVVLTLALFPNLASLKYAFDTDPTETEGDDAISTPTPSSRTVRRHLTVFYIGGLKHGAVDIVFRHFDFPALVDCQLLMIMPIVVAQGKSGDSEKPSKKWREPLIFPASLRSWTQRATSLRITTRQQMTIVDCHSRGDFRLSIYARYPFGFNHPGFEGWGLWDDLTSRSIEMMFQSVDFLKLEGSLPTSRQWLRILQKGMPKLRRLVIFGPSASNLGLTLNSLPRDPPDSVRNQLLVMKLWDLDPFIPSHGPSQGTGTEFSSAIKFNFARAASGAPLLLCSVRSHLLDIYHTRREVAED
ncbi:hypothetical protein SISSUDRAFT_1067601 [Sistotremastrum suecicum HHB10207 ss-3]|uniref:Uncharacterized protein n=1 Tax=Sistotremastrum suecicum HHB10207 ss-3 TaxID=1314776 RepID=A0A165WXS2_9AGAM|nr:hypothetical protein SISSUDRAFT_1067601 [Sistotremastrum suecicum HHB10207 ss-3]